MFKGSVEDLGGSVGELAGKGLSSVSELGYKAIEALAALTGGTPKATK